MVLRSYTTRLLILAFLVGSVLSCSAPVGVTSKAPETAARKEAKIGSKLLRDGNFQDAIVALEASHKMAIEAGDEKTVLDILISKAGYHFLLYSHREAIRLYIEALALAKKLRNKDMETIAASNIASNYLSLGEADKAEAILLAYPLDGPNIPESIRLDCMLLRGNVYSKLKRYAEADSAYSAALEEARNVPKSWLAPNPKIAAKSWDEAPKELRRAWVLEVIGQSLIDRHFYEDAEFYLLEAFRVRSTYGDPARFRESIKLAMLMGRKGQNLEAKRLLHLARGLALKGRSLFQILISHREEAKILLAEGRPLEAMEHLRSALSYGRAWRMEAIPSDSAYLRFESHLNTEVHELFLNAIAGDATLLKSKSAAAESFWVAEEARYASMRAAQFPASALRDRLPSAYWAKLNRYQALQSVALGGDRAPSSNLKTLEEELNLMELTAGVAIPHAQSDPRLAFTDWQRRIPSDELVFSFYFGEPYSLAWTVSAKTIHIRRIAGRKQLRKMIQSFRRQTLEPSLVRTPSTGLVLARELFGDFLYSHRTTPIWTVVLDDELSSLPLAAMPTDETQTRYLIQDHALRVLPSAIHLRPAQPEPWKRLAIALSDPIYNPADARLKQGNASPTAKLNFASGLELSRLPFTADEVEASFAVCRRANFSAAVYSGSAANLQNLRAAIAASPDILHVATHIVSSPQTPDQTFIALSAAELFGPLDLNANRTSARLVVLSGCNSSAGELVSGIGVAGLSRAWLIGGASSVLATLWPTKDVPGPFFPIFYEALVAQPWSSRATAIALRQAQMQMLRRIDWYSQPAYWAAYIPISRG